jgi:hypothetical protein
MHRNGIILQDIQIALAEASSGADRASSATAATVEIAAAVVSMGLSLLAGNPLLVPPQLPASAVAPATGLQSFTARGIIASSASQLTASLHGVASQLTHFELGLLMRMQPDQWGETPFAVPPSTAGLPVLAGMRNLRSLVLHQPCEVHANMGSGMWPPFTDCLQQCVSNMQQLTRLELPVHMGDFEGLQEMEQYLPASLQELRLGADAGVAGDEGAIAFGVTEADDVSPKAACLGNMYFKMFKIVPCCNFKVPSFQTGCCCLYWHAYLAAADVMHSVKIRALQLPSQLLSLSARHVHCYSFPTPTR